MKKPESEPSPLTVKVETTEVSVPIEKLAEQTRSLFDGLVAAEARLWAANGEPEGQRQAASGALFAVHSFVQNLADDDSNRPYPYTVLRLLMTALIDIENGVSPPAFLQVAGSAKGRPGAPPASGRQKHIKSAAVACFHALHKAGYKKADAGERVARVFNAAGLNNDLPQSRGKGISGRAVSNWASGTEFGNRKRPTTAMVLESEPNKAVAERFLSEMAQMLSRDQSFGRSAQIDT
jgi:hypothetical protein